MKLEKELKKHIKEYNNMVNKSQELKNRIQQKIGIITYLKDKIKKDKIKKDKIKKDKIKKDKIKKDKIKNVERDNPKI